nr:MAG TPA: hypothetical protein [Bacteriophage sp.]
MVVGFLFLCAQKVHRKCTTNKTHPNLRVRCQ